MLYKETLLERKVEPFRTLLIEKLRPSSKESKLPDLPEPSKLSMNEIEEISNFSWEEELGSKEITLPPIYGANESYRTKTKGSICKFHLALIDKFHIQIYSSPDEFNEALTRVSRNTLTPYQHHKWVLGKGHLPNNSLLSSLMTEDKVALTLDSNVDFDVDRNQAVAFIEDRNNQSYCSLIIYCPHSDKVSIKSK